MLDIDLAEPNKFSGSVLIAANSTADAETCAVLHAAEMDVLSVEIFYLHADPAPVTRPRDLLELAQAQSEAVGWTMNNETEQLVMSFDRLPKWSVLMTHFRLPAIGHGP